MKTKIKEINIYYSVYDDGEDFKDIENLYKNIDQEYFLSLNKKRTEGYGSGMYELVVEIIENYALIDLVKSYVDDGIKIAIGMQFREIIRQIAPIFAKNHHLKPSVEKLIIKFKDCKITIYEIYKRSIEENHEKLINSIAEFLVKKRKKLKGAINVHIPIFKKKDTYKLCKYRVKLDVDENIPEFYREDYFKLWGIKTNKKMFIYKVQKDKLINNKFYTQSRYDKLFKKYSKKNI